MSGLGEWREQVAAEIGKHAPTVDNYGEPRAAGCSGGCDFKPSSENPYRRHLADVLLAPGGVVAEMVAGERARSSLNDEVRRVQIRMAREQGAAEVRARIVRARGNHPACDRHDDGDPVTCGWKRAVQDIDAALDDERGDR